MFGNLSRLRIRTRILRPVLTATTTAFVLLALFLYFLYDCSFFFGAQTLTERADQNLMRRESETAIEYLRAGMPNDLAQRDNEKVNAYRAHFKSENSNFCFCFWIGNDAGNGGKDSVLNNYPAGYSGTDDERTGALPYADAQALLMREENKDLAGVFQDLRFEAYVRQPLTAHDDFFRVRQTVQTLRTLRVPALVLFVLLALFEGWLWVRLCGNALAGQIAPALQELSGTPIYMLLTFYLLAAANVVWLLHTPLHTLYARATFADLRDVRPALYTALLLLALLSYLTTLLVTLLCARLSQPKWYRRSVIYRAVNMPSVERRMQMWLTAALTLELAVFLLLFLRFSIEDGRLFVLIDALFLSVIVLMTYMQSKSTSAYMRATHRIALEQHGAVPTGDLRGKSLEHVQNINFLSRSAGEQMQLRFVNEAFGTKLIRSVSHSLRDPLTAVTAEAEKLQNGGLTEAQTRQSVRQINALSQELKRSIEDLLRIANASAEGNEAHCVPTDAGLMIEQAVGEFYDRFRQKDVLLVRQLSTEPLRIPADGAYMWTVFESVLNEFLQYAVPGTRVFLQTQRRDETVHFCIRGAVREDAMPERRSLALPTAKVFTEKQGGVYSDALLQDQLTVELRFPLCTDE